MTALDRAREALRDRQGAGARYDAAAAPADDLAVARRGRAYLSRIVQAIEDAALGQPSSRPGASRRRLVAEVALHAREVAQAIEDATGRPGDRAETGPAALDLAETLPARALRYLFHHAEIHLDVVWRDLSDADWDLTADIGGAAHPLRDTPRLHGAMLWRAALELGAGARTRDLPGAIAAELRDRPRNSTRKDPSQ